MFLADSIADISHQIKTPLTSINLILNFLREEDITYERRMDLVMELTTLAEKNKVADKQHYSEYQGWMPIW